MAKEKLSGLVIFDIDQTLVQALDVHKAATIQTLREVFGIEGRLEDVDYEGQTIRRNLTEICKFHDVPASMIAKKMSSALKKYDSNFIRLLKSTKRSVALPGAKDAVSLASKHHKLAIVTGGTKKVATALLRREGLYKHFKIFVFGDKALRREQLVNQAIIQAGVARKDVLAIGDSIRDIEAARRNNIRIISVQTGTTGYTRLKSANPNYLLRDLTDKRVKGLLGGDYVG